jgi:hypothetical protein
MKNLAKINQDQEKRFSIHFGKRFLQFLKRARQKL